MTTRIFFRILFVCISFGISLQSLAQTETPASAAISGEEQISAIMQGSEGDIEINIAPEIVQLIFSEPQAPKRNAAPVHRKESKSNKGYRIQVFGEAGNQATLASRCRARGSMVLAKFPKYRGQLYIFSKSPHWYCRVGNFRTSAEAAKAAGELRRAFPQFAGEIRTVQSTIVPK